MTQWSPSLTEVGVIHADLTLTDVLILKFTENLYNQI